MTKRLIALGSVFPPQPTRRQFTPEASQTQAPVSPATEPERRAGGGLTTIKESLTGLTNKAVAAEIGVRQVAPIDRGGRLGRTCDLVGLCNVVAQGLF